MPDRDLIDLTEYNSLHKVFRIIPHMKGFISRLKKQKKKFPSYITASELSDSAMTLLRQEQRNFFADEIETIQTSPQVNSK